MYVIFVCVWASIIYAFEHKDKRECEGTFGGIENLKFKLTKFVFTRSLLIVVFIDFLQCQFCQSGRFLHAARFGALAHSIFCHGR